MYSLLVVEDEKILREGIVRLVNFSLLGIEKIASATDGVEALEIFKKKPFDIVLTDINMPHLDGIHFSQEIKKIKEDVKIIFLTGYDYFDYALSAVKLHAFDYLLKPLSRKDIEQVLLKVVQHLKYEEKQKAVQLLASVPVEDDMMQYIQQNLGNHELSLQKVADHFSFSPNYLSHLIKKNLGITFQDYVLQERMNKAKILLLGNRFKIYEVAEQVGFEDVNYFSSRFKQMTGKTPKQFQKEG